jgi:hypothetical protein
MKRDFVALIDCHKLAITLSCTQTLVAMEIRGFQPCICAPKKAEERRAT